MNLDEWLSLSEEERSRLKQQALSYGSQADGRYNEAPWEEAGVEASQQFMAEFGDDARVRFASVTRDGSSIWVATDAAAGESVAGLPDVYASFRVVQEPLKEAFDAYRTAWKVTLMRLLRWPEEQALRCVEETEDWVFDSAWFNHELPLYWLSGTLVRECGLVAGVDVSKLSDKTYWAAQHAIERCVGEFLQEPDQTPESAWEEARRQVRAIITSSQ